MSAEKRWIILGTDGRHVTVGRHTDPSPDEIEAAEAGLRAQGLSGWLAVTDGGYYGPGEIAVLPVRSLADALPETWDRAVAAFLEHRAVARGCRRPGRTNSGAIQSCLPC
jgi:hypothetical protein